MSETFLEHALNRSRRRMRPADPGTRHRTGTCHCKEIVDRLDGDIAIESKKASELL